MLPTPDLDFSETEFIYMYDIQKPTLPSKQTLNIQSMETALDFFRHRKPVLSVPVQENKPNYEAKPLLRRADSL